MEHCKFFDILSSIEVTERVELAWGFAEVPRAELSREMQIHTKLHKPTLRVKC